MKTLLCTGTIQETSHLTTAITRAHTPNRRSTWTYTQHITFGFPSLSFRVCSERTDTEASAVMNTDTDVSVCECVLSIWCEAVLQASAGI